MIRVLDLARSIDFYDRALGLKVYEQFEFDDFTLVYLRNEEIEFERELTLNKGRTEPCMVMAMAILPYARRIAVPNGSGLRQRVATRRGQGISLRRRTHGALLLHSRPRRI
jgi:catechol 2,3-dioxygenase-like lactoylglutathione lyase family enzyme